MPAELKVRILEARALPVMDSARNTTDAFVEIHYGNQVKKTPVTKQSLNPVFGVPGKGLVFELEVPDDAGLQDDPLQLKVFDHDTFSAHDVIGVVYIDLNPLLAYDVDDESLVQPLDKIAGWFPIFDTLRGVRGQLHAEVSLTFLANQSETQTTSSAGVQFFSSNVVPECFRVERVYGFVEELLVKDDPASNSQFMRTQNTDRFTNAERQALLYQLSGELRRHLGRKVLNIGGNAVLGYVKELDLEGRSLVARGYGTAVLLTPRPALYTLDSLTSNQLPDSQLAKMLPQSGSVFEKLNAAENLTKGAAIGDSLTIDTDRLMKGFNRPMLITLVSLGDSAQGWRVRRIGGLLMVRAVKRVDESGQERLASNNKDDDTQTSFGAKTVESESTEEAARDSWWHEVRDEMRAHCKFLGCNVVLGYTESNTLLRKSGVSILTGCGTAVVVEDIRASPADIHFAPDVVLVNKDSSVSSDEDQGASKVDVVSRKSGFQQSGDIMCPCDSSHLPGQFPLRSGQSRRKTALLDTMCSICHRFPVPDVLLATCEPPADLQVINLGGLIEARVCRELKKFADDRVAFKPKKQSTKHFFGKSSGSKSKSSQVEAQDTKRGDKKLQRLLRVSDVLPFVQYELHNQLLKKLRVRGYNAVFRLDFQLSMSKRFLVCVATGTAAIVPSLPRPPSYRLGDPARTDSVWKQQLVLTRLSEAFRAKISQEEHLRPANLTAQQRLLCHFGLHWWRNVRDSSGGIAFEPDVQPEEQSPNHFVEVAPRHGTQLNSRKDFMIPASDDMDDALSMHDPQPPLNMTVCNTNSLIGSQQPLQSSGKLITVVRRVNWHLASDGADVAETPGEQLSAMVHQMYSSVYFRLRALGSGIALTAWKLYVQLPDDKSVQLVLTAAVSMTVNSRMLSLVEAMAYEDFLGSPLSLGPQLAHARHRFAPTSSSFFPPVNEELETEFFGRPIESNSHFARYPQPDSNSSLARYPQPVAEPHFVELSPMSHLPGAILRRYVGRVDIHLIREAAGNADSYQNSAMSADPALGGRTEKGSFTHDFLEEIHAVLRAHVRTLGGNVLLSYSFDEFEVTEKQTQKYALISISGDAFFAEMAAGGQSLGVSHIVASSSKFGLFQPGIAEGALTDVTTLRPKKKTKRVNLP